MKDKTAKEDFMDAFWILYAQKRIEKISVRELCELAGYNRTTFYVYFKDIYDLLGQFIELRVLPDTSSIPVSDILVDFAVVQRIMCYLFERNNRYIQVILRNYHSYILQEAIVLRVKAIAAQDMGKEFEYVVRYQVSAILGLLEFWQSQGAEQITKQQLLTLIYEVTTRGAISSLIKYKDGGK